MCEVGCDLLLEMFLWLPSLSSVWSISGTGGDGLPKCAAVGWSFLLTLHIAY